MTILLRSDWESCIWPKVPKAYPLGTQDHKVVDDTFDELHKHNRMSWTIESTLFLYPVFVVWKTRPDSKCKGCVVVDMYELNQLALSDVYLLPL